MSPGLSPTIGLALRCLGAAACLLVFGCSHNVGDACQSNVDCDPTGGRFCDTSAPGGYCTIDGCDVATCPSEAVCVRFFTPIRNLPCDPSLVGWQGDLTAQCERLEALHGLGCCLPYQRCLCDHNNPDGSCSTSAHCAPESSERRWCQLTCSSDSDCRSGYQCRSTGSLGAEPVPSLATPRGQRARFCAPASP